jgi:zinc protease
VVFRVRSGPGGAWTVTHPPSFWTAARKLIMRHVRSALLAPLLVAGFATATFAQQADLSASLPLDPQVRAGRLDNGIRYLIRRNTRPEQRAELMLTVNVGSVLEDDDQRGLAHFVEHMAFNGTRNFEKQELVSYLESIGMRFGADLNAYTGFDETVYMLTVPTDTGTALQTGIQILEEWAHNVSFDPAEIDKERGVVVEEWRLGQGAGARMRDQVFPVLFQNSRYAERLPIGTRESLETFTHDRLIRYYRDWYRPELMSVIAVGDFDPAAVEAMIRERFSTLTAPAEARPRTVYPVPDHDQPMVVIATDPEATSTSVDVYFKQPVGEKGTYGAYRRSIIENLYNGMLNARFSEIARRADPPFIGAGSSVGGLVRTRASYSLGAGVPEGGVITGLDAILTEGLRVARHGFTDTELEREKRDLLRFYETAYAERDKTESSTYANEYVRHVLEDESVPGIALEFDLVKRYMPDITLEQVNALASTWMSEQNRVVVVQTPRKEGVALPTGQEILGVFATVAQKEITPWVDIVADDELVASPPPPATVVSERSIDAIGVTEWTLSNGARVLLKPTDFKDDEILFRAWSPGGLSLVSDAEYISASVASTLVGTSGLGEHDATTLQKALAGKAVRVQPAMDDLSEGLAGAASPADLETMLQLVYLHFTATRQDSVAVASLLTRLRAFLQNSAAAPEAAFSDTLSVTLAQYHPRARPVSVASIDEIDPDRAFEIYRDRISDASDFTFTFVGSFQPDSIRPLILQWIGGLPATNRTESWRDNGIRPPAGRVEKIVRKGVEPKSQTAIVFNGPFEYSRANAHVLRSLIEVLDMRLRDQLREELGGTYGVNIGQSATRDPYPHYGISIVFGSAPERADSLSTVVFAEIEKLRTAGVDAETLQKVKEAQRRSFETDARQNNWWVAHITAAVRLGMEPDGMANLPALIDGLTSDQIAEAARLYLTPEQYVKVVLLPENNRDTGHAGPGTGR